MMMALKPVGSQIISDNWLNLMKRFNKAVWPAFTINLTMHELTKRIVCIVAGSYFGVSET